MAVKPSFIGWIPNNTTGITTVPGGKLAIGWVSAEKPPFQYMNWFFNIVSQWINFAGWSSYDVVVGTTAGCSHASLAAAVADSAVGTNQRVLITQNATLASVINLTKAGWRIDFLPGVTYTAGAATQAFSLQADKLEVWNGRFSGFTTAIIGTSAWTYGKVLFTNFASCTNEVDYSAVPAGKLPVTLGTITE